MVCDSKGRDVQTYTHSQCACCNYRAKGAKHLLQCVVNAGMISGNRLTEHGQLSSSEHPLYALAVSSIHPCVMVAHSIHHKICRKTALSEMTDQLYLHSCNKHIYLSVCCPSMWLLLSAVCTTTTTTIILRLFSLIEHELSPLFVL